MKWEKVTLDKLGTISRGKSKHRPRNDPSLFGGEYPFIQTSDIKNATFYITDYTDTYNEKGLSQSKLWEPDTLCITIAANIADTAILGIKACFPDSVMGFISYEGVSDVRFVKYSFDILQSEMKQISRGTAQDNLSWQKLSSITFPKPPYETQKRIADYLFAFEKLIENNQKQIKLLEEAAQRLYKEWFVDLRFPGHETTSIVDGMPEGWQMKSISDFGVVITGKTPSTSQTEFYDGDIPFVKIPDMHNCVFPISTESTLSELGANSQKNKYIPKNSIMVSCIATVGLVNISVQTCQTNQQINSIVLAKNQDLYYLYFCMKGIRSLLDGVGSNGATMTNVNKSKFENLNVIYPTDNLIDRFHNVCEPVFSDILKLSVMNNYLTDSRDRLLPKLMNGEIEV